MMAIMRFLVFDYARVLPDDAMLSSLDVDPPFHNTTVTYLGVC